MLVRRGYRDKSGIIFIFFPIKVYVVRPIIRIVSPDGSKKGSQYMFYYVYLYCTGDDLNKL